MEPAVPAIRQYRVEVEAFGLMDIDAEDNRKKVYA